MVNLDDDEYLCIDEGEVQIVEGHGHMEPAGWNITNHGAGTGVSVVVEGCKHTYDYMENRDDAYPFDMQVTLASYNGEIWESALFDGEWMGSLVTQFPHNGDKRFMDQLLAHDFLYVGFTYPDVDEAPDECEGCRDLDNAIHTEHVHGFDTSPIRDQLQFIDSYVGEPVTQSPSDQLIKQR